MEREGEKPRLLMVDIETLPLLMYAWQPWEATALRIVEDTAICSWSAKWLGGKHITKALCDYEGYEPGSRDDKALLADLWALLDEADQVCAHNGDRFDVKKINSRFMVHGMLPPSPYQQIDTLKAVKSVASFDSHKLDELCRVLELGRKMRTGGKDLWFDCIEGDPKAWTRMKKYNAHDVRLLEEFYLTVRPWMKNHPNLSTHSGLACCPKCGSTKLQGRGKARTATQTYQRFQCQGCGGWARDTKAIDERASVVNAR